MPGAESGDGGVALSGRVRVWDLPVRLFHWTVVGLVALSWLSVENGFLILHQWSGLTLLALLLFRIAWGFAGSTTARFTDFVRGPGQALSYLRALSRGNRILHPGHNPAGGWMVMALLMILMLQATTGLYANDGVHFSGPLAGQVSSDISDRLTSLHGSMFNVVIALVWIHVVAVLFYTYVRGENLIAPMISGDKPGDQVPAGTELKFAAYSWALLWLALAAGAVWWMVRP